MLEKVEALVRLVLDRLSQDARGQVIVAEYRKAPQVFEQPIAQRLGEALSHDADFAAQVQRDLARYEAAVEAHGASPQVNYQATLRGTDSIAPVERTIAPTATDSAIAVGTASGHVVIAKDRVKVYMGEQPIPMTGADRESALAHYLRHIISRNRYLQLQGIRSGGRLVNIELDQIYITLRTTRQQTAVSEAAWLQAESRLSPGERDRHPDQLTTLRETLSISINEALAKMNRLVVLGDPGSGKTTLMRYLALIYARDIAEQENRVQRDLGLKESGYLPILLYLRQMSAFLHAHRPADDGVEGHGLLLDFLTESLTGDRVSLSDGFFTAYLQTGRAIILLDGLDEVADGESRRRVARIVEAFCRAYPICRYVITSRIVGYSGSARLGEAFTTTTVRDFTMADVTRFLENWHRLVAVGQMGPGQSAEVYAAEQTRQLREAIESNDRIRDLAINPLMLTVIAVVHRDRVKLPDRRAELYAEAIDVLLGKWDAAHGVQEMPILSEHPFDTGDKRLILQNLALQMQAAQQKEIALADLRPQLGAMFYDVVADEREAERAVDRFLQVITERTGLLVARGEGVYAFSHLTFQEYLAALAVIERDDYIDYLLARSADFWWYEIILLCAGHLSTQGKQRVTRLIEAIAHQPDEAQPYHNLVLATQALHDVGQSRVAGNLLSEVQHTLREELSRPIPQGWLGAFHAHLRHGMSPKAMAERRIAAAEALAQVGGETHWTPPYGEPAWIEVPAGEFWLGSDHGTEAEKPAHRLYLDTFFMALTPITNAQYHLFIQATDHQPPYRWEDKRPPKGLESHPVVNVSWLDAMTYCRWLSEMTGKSITLPTEAQWEKAARGPNDQRDYPWGRTFELTHCNSGELGLNQTTPVGIFPAGASFYGCLDMAGNVWEWTRSLWGGWDAEAKAAPLQLGYPYDAADGREALAAATNKLWVLRGGAFWNDASGVRCTGRNGNDIDYGLGIDGFRVVLGPI